eukprot:325746-Chlamydomonas_euryale.AAC.2
MLGARRYLATCTAADSAVSTCMPVPECQVAVLRLRPRAERVCELGGTRVAQLLRVGNIRPHHLQLRVLLAVRALQFLYACQHAELVSAQQLRRSRRTAAAACATRCRQLRRPRLQHIQVALPRIDRQAQLLGALLRRLEPRAVVVQQRRRR